MEFLKIAALIFITVIIVTSIPTFSKEITILITVCSCLVVVFMVVEQIKPVIEYLKSLADLISFNSIEVIMKAVGVGFITQFVSDIAIDCSNKSLSNQMILIGRVTVLIISMPIILEVFKILERLVG